MSALDALASWPVDRAAGAVVAEGGAREAAGDTAWETRIASVTKLLVAYACLVALEEGTLTLDQPAGPPGSFECLGETLAGSAGMSVATYLAEAVLRPLGMGGTELRGSPAKDAWSTADDLGRFAAELLAPTLVDPATLGEATSEQFPGLAGVVPGLGSYDPNPWGLGFELKDRKVRLACVVLTDREFGDWAPPLWSALSSAVLTEHSMA